MKINGLLKKNSKHHVHLVSDHMAPKCNSYWGAYLHTYIQYDILELCSRDYVSLYTFRRYASPPRGHRRALPRPLRLRQRVTARSDRRIQVRRHAGERLRDLQVHGPDLRQLNFSLFLGLLRQIFTALNYLSQVRFSTSCAKSASRPLPSCGCAPGRCRRGACGKPPAPSPPGTSKKSTLTSRPFSQSSG